MILTSGDQGSPGNSGMHRRDFDEIMSCTRYGVGWGFVEGNNIPNQDIDSPEDS